MAVIAYLKNMQLLSFGSAWQYRQIYLQIGLVNIET